MQPFFFNIHSRSGHWSFSMLRPKVKIKNTLCDRWYSQGSAQKTSRTDWHLKLTEFVCPLQPYLHITNSSISLRVLNKNNRDTTYSICFIMGIFKGLEHSKNLINAHGWSRQLVVDLLEVSVGSVLHFLAERLGHLWEDVGHVSGCVSWSWNDTTCCIRLRGTLHQS